MSLQDDIWDLEDELAYARKHPEFRTEVYFPGRGTVTMGAPELEAEIARLKARQAAIDPVPARVAAARAAKSSGRKGRKAKSASKPSATRASSGAAYCSICKGPHVYKHGRP